SASDWEGSNWVLSNRATGATYPAPRSPGHFRKQRSVRAVHGACSAPNGVKYDRRMNMFASAEVAAAPTLRDRQDIPTRFKWDLTHIFTDWEAWQTAYEDLESKIDAFAALHGTLAGGRQNLLTALRLRDEIGQLEYKVWYFASLWYDQDQRDNQINAKRQQVQILFAKAAQAAAWLDQEWLKIPGGTGKRGWPSIANWPSTDLRSRTYTVNRNTCSTTKASTCCRWRAASKALRTTPTRRCRPRTPSFQP